MDEHKENIDNRDVNLKMSDNREKVGVGNELASCLSPEDNTHYTGGSETRLTSHEIYIIKNKVSIEFRLSTQTLTGINLTNFTTHHLLLFLRPCPAGPVLEMSQTLRFPHRRPTVTSVTRCTKRSP